MNVALESLAEHDRRVKWERRRKDLLTLAEWLLVIAIAGAVGAGIGFTYGIDHGKGIAERKAAQTLAPTCSCRSAQSLCVEKFRDNFYKR